MGEGFGPGFGPSVPDPQVGDSKAIFMRGEVCLRSLGSCLKPAAFAMWYGGPEAGGRLPWAT